MAAKVKILIEGYTNADSKAESGGEEKTCPTITLVRDGGLVIVVDPGVLDSQQILINALQNEGLTISDVNMICITHSHIDHYRNIGMFPKAKTLEYFGVWDKGRCEDWQEHFTPNIQILRTPGHDYTSITLFVNTDNGIVAICGDVFWRENKPETDAYATEPEKLRESRQTVLKLADWIIPGHGKMYKVENRELPEPKKPANKKAPKLLGLCRKCKRLIIIQQDWCICQPTICYRCCECDIDCEVCNCKHRRK